MTAQSSILDRPLDHVNLASAPYPQFIKDYLHEQSEESYRQFAMKLLPRQGSALRILGVRIPILRDLGRKLARAKWRDYVLRPAEQDESFEEIMLRGLIIGSVKETKELLPYLNDYIPRIDNWSLCDSFVCGLKALSKDPAPAWPTIRDYLNSGSEYSARFGLITAMRYYGCEPYLTQVLEYIPRLKTDAYYTRMGAAWLIAEYYPIAPQTVLPYLQRNGALQGNQIRIMALSKLRESRRITAKDKAYFLELIHD